MHTHPHTHSHIQVHVIDRSIDKYMPPGNSKWEAGRRRHGLVYVCMCVYVRMHICVCIYICIVFVCVRAVLNVCFYMRVYSPSLLHVNRGCSWKSNTRTLYARIDLYVPVATKQHASIGSGTHKRWHKPPPEALKPLSPPNRLGCYDGSFACKCRVRLHTHAHTHSTSHAQHTYTVHQRTHTCMRVCEHACVSARSSRCVCSRVCVRVRVCTCMRVCTRLKGWPTKGFTNP